MVVGVDDAQPVFSARATVTGVARRGARRALEEGTAGARVGESDGLREAGRQTWSNGLQAHNVDAGIVHILGYGFRFSRLFQGCFKAVSRRFQGCFKAVSRLFLGCF